MTHVTISIEDLKTRCTDEEIMKVLGLGNGLTVEVRENKPVETTAVPKKRTRAKVAPTKTATPTAEEQEEVVNKETEADQKATEVPKAAPKAKAAPKGPTKSQLTGKAIEVLKVEGGKDYVLEICENFNIKKISLAKESDWSAILEKLEAFLDV